MKKILFLLLFFVPILMYGQRRIETGSIITSVDTTVFIQTFFGKGWSIAFEYGTLDADDWTISLGNSKDRSYDELDDIRLPYTLNVTTHAYTDESGNSRATVTFESDAWRSETMAIQVDVGTANADTITYQYIQE